MTKPAERTPAEQFIQNLSALTEPMAALVEATAGHRAQLERAGFSPTMAERGALTYHDALLAAMVQQRKR